ncbi:MAG TPA: D-alanyl-D-alanine carboxypeptidase [Firmicutes bacterium]|jgi:D-alanyl-D-alanine carboxypeptidase (penicillin-binding protein 5/6)|nr:D-alanyl-D-alanine carboxypeptidase [Bacillota bacterium]HOQ23503.1 D-alanyl-D-alanine carboxypeptidase family protein [Bacillota bacterium]HPT67999.1 D-alanyl-D-alanine carboxypeptidase family protein [Bacillota bacterium]
MDRLRAFLFILITLIIAQPLHAKGNPRINAQAAVLMDAGSGKVLYAKNAFYAMFPASTTKIMTAVLALELGKLNAKVPISIHAATREGTAMNISPGETWTLQQLLYGLLLSSGNDAAAAIGEYISGSETRFAHLMTEKAWLLGMGTTQFKNASGLPHEGHYTTAYDLALLTRYAMKKPLFRKIVKTKEITLNGPGGEVTLCNHNKLLWRYPYATGVKTGYTTAAGGCLVATAQKNNVTLIAVVMKTGTIYDDVQQLLEYGFTQTR